MRHSQKKKIWTLQIPLSTCGCSQGSVLGSHPFKITQQCKKGRQTHNAHSSTQHLSRKQSIIDQIRAGTPGGNHNSNFTFSPQYYCAWMWILKQYMIHHSSLRCFTCSSAACFRSPNITAAAKSLQSCPTLCDPIDGSPPGSPVPGILQARTLEWVAICLWDSCILFYTTVHSFCSWWALGLPAIRVHRNSVAVNPGVCVLCANVWQTHWNLCSGAELSPF